MTRAWPSLLAVLLLSACAAERVGIARLSLGPEGAPDGVDRMTLLLSGPDLAVVEIPVDPEALTFDVPVPPGDARVLTLLAEHEQGDALQPWYWGSAGFDLHADEVVDVVVPAVPATRIEPLVLMAGLPVVGATIVSQLEAPEPDLPARFEDVSDAEGEASRIVPAGAYCLSATADIAGVARATLPGAFQVVAGQGETVRVPLSIVEPALDDVIDHLELEVTGLRVGEVGDLVVRAVDALGQPVPSFDGLVSFAASDGAAVLLPAPYRFVAADAGEHRFTGGLTGLEAAVGVAIRAQVDGQGTLMAERTIDVLALGEAVGQATRLAIEVLGELEGGLLARPVDLRVTALDDAGRIATGYRGTITFADSDLLLLALPPDTSFTEQDQGSHLFARGLLPLIGTGLAVVRVRDLALPDLAGTLSLQLD